MTIHPFLPVLLVTAIAGSAAAAPKAATPAAGGPNLVRNGSFNEGGARPASTGGEIKDWEIVRPEGMPPVVEVALDPAVTHSGGASVRMHGTAGATGVARLRQVLASARPGATYRLSGWVRQQGVENPRHSIGLRMRWRWRVEEYAAPVETQGEWTRWEKVVAVPPKAEEIVVEAMLQWTGGTVWFDDIRVEEVPTQRRPVRVASVYWRPQTRSTPEKNLQKWCELVDQAAAQKADIICLPETMLGIGTGGPGPSDAQPIPGPATETLGAHARAHKIWICAGLSEKEGDRMYNTAVLIDRAGKLVGKYRKTHLPIQEVEAGFTPGEALPVWDTELGKIGILICHDTAFPEPARALALKGAELVMLPIWGGADLYVLPRAAENAFFLVSASYDYPSGVISPAGKWLAQSPKSPDGTVVVKEIDLEDVYRTESYEGRFHSIHRRERNPKIYGDLVAPGG